MNYLRSLSFGQTFIGNKRNKVWVWTVVNHWKPGIMLWTVGDRSSSSFQILWSTIRCGHSFWYVTDGWKVYPCFIEPEDHLVCKTYMTRVEGENTRLRHYLARLHRKSGKTPRRRHKGFSRMSQGNACQDTLCYSKS